MKRSVAVFALAVSLSACGNSTRTAGSRSSSDVVTRTEMMKAPVDNLFDALQRLRPGFLRARSTGSNTNAYPVVYVDGMRRGGIDFLRSISSNSVQEVRYLSAIDATTRYGLNIEAGVIQVTMVGR